MNKLVYKYRSLPKMVKASFWFLVCSFLQKGMAVLTTPIFTRLMDTDQYGQYSVFSSWLYIVQIVITLNLFGDVYQRGLVTHEKDRKAFASSMQGLTFTLTSIWTVIYLIFHNSINQWIGLSTPLMLCMIGIVWTTVVSYFWASYQRVTWNYKGLVIVTACVTILGPLLGIFLVLHMENKVLGRVLGILVVQLMFYAWMFVWQEVKGKQFFNAAVWKNALKFNVPLVPHYMSQTLLSSSDRIMIEKLVNYASVGIYSLAYNVAQIMTMFNQALMDTLNPWIYKNIQDNRIKEIAPVGYASFVLIAAVNLMLMAFAPEAVAIFAPPQYASAIFCIPPIAMSVYFMYIYDFFAKFEFYFKRTKTIAAITLTSAVLNIVGNWICIQQFGYVAAAYTTLACYILNAVLHYLGMRSVCKTELNAQYPFNTTILIILSAAFMAIGFLYLASYINIWIRFGLTGVLLIIAAATYNKWVPYINRIAGMRK